MPDTLEKHRMMVEPEESVLLTPLGGGQQELPARIVQISGRRLSISCEAVLPVGTTLKLVWSDRLILGEVIAVENNGRTCLVQIRHVLDPEVLKEIQARWI